DGELPPSDDEPRGKKKKGKAGPSDLEDGPLPGEDSGGERVEWGSGGSGPAAEEASDKTGLAAVASPGKAAASTCSQEVLAADGTPGWQTEAKGGPRERVVFGADGAEASKSKASGTAQGEDDKDERTDQIDISKLKRDDPFAQSGKRAALRDPAAIAA